LEEDMTEFPGADGGQITDVVTGLTAAADEVVAARPELVWDLVADITRVGGWSPECIRAAWLGEPGRPRAGARFTGHNRSPNGFEYEVTCVVTEADRPRAFAWVVLDDSGDPARPSSSWQYRIDPLPGGGSRVRQRFTHGPGVGRIRAWLMGPRGDGPRDVRLPCTESPAGVAQQAEQPSCKRQVSGSNPLTGSQVRRVFGLFSARSVERFVERMSVIGPILLLCLGLPKVT
jgi:uncharacterized protein YndB with AHSA1/START domain